MQLMSNVGAHVSRMKPKEVYFELRDKYEGNALPLRLANVFHRASPAFSRRSCQTPGIVEWGVHARCW
jgi:hypothetical protein